MVKALLCSRKNQYQPCANYVTMYLLQVFFIYNVEMICFPCSIVTGTRNNSCRILSFVPGCGGHSKKQGLLYWFRNQCFLLMKPQCYKWLPYICVKLSDPQSNLNWRIFYVFSLLRKAFPYHPGSIFLYCFESTICHFSWLGHSFYMYA